MAVNENLLVIHQVLNLVVLIEQVCVERAGHVRANGSDDSVEDIAVAARPRRCIRLGPSAVGIVVATNDVDVRLGALPARMMLDQMQIREPQTALSGW